jgi:hypothetical protein
MSSRSGLPATSVLFAEIPLSLVPVILHGHPSGDGFWGLTCGTWCVPSALSAIAGRDFVLAVWGFDRCREGITLQLELTSLSSGNTCAVVVVVVMGVVVGVIMHGLLRMLLSALVSGVLIVICALLLVDGPCSFLCDGDGVGGQATCIFINFLCSVCCSMCVS